MRSGLASSIGRPSPALDDVTLMFSTSMQAVGRDCRAADFTQPSAKPVKAAAMDMHSIHDPLLRRG